MFAGSQFYVDPSTKKERYAADDGDLITVANFASAILDLPIESSANDADRAFSTNTAQIPAIGTEVLVALYPGRPSQRLNQPQRQRETHEIRRPLGIASRAGSSHREIQNPYIHRRTLGLDWQFNRAA